MLKRILENTESWNFPLTESDRKYLLELQEEKTECEKIISQMEKRVKLIEGFRDEVLADARTRSANCPDAGPAATE